MRKGGRVGCVREFGRVGAVGAAVAFLASGGAGAVNLVFDASPAPISTPQVADTSFWIGVNLPNVIASIVSGGAVTVNAGGHSAALGINAGSSGNRLTLTGAPATLTVAESIYVGNAGAGNTLVFDQGATGSSGSFYMGAVSGSTANDFQLLAQSLLTTSGDVGLGVAAGAGSNTATVDATGSVWTINGVTYVGNAAGANQLTISGGGEVKASTLDTLIGAEPGADGNKILVTGANSKATLYTGVLRTLYVGRSGNSNTLEILAGGQVASGNVRIGGGTGATGSPTGNGVVVDGGSTWTIAGTMRVGAGVAGTNSGLDITNGGVVTVTGNSFVGYDAVNDDNHVLVSGPGSQLNVQALTISRVVGAANNTVTVANGGTLSAASITLGAATGTSVGGLEIGAGGPAGVIAPTTITGVGSDPTVRFNHTSAGHAFAPALSGTLALVHDGAGSTELGGAGTYTGPTTVNAGALRLNGVSGTNAIAVNAGGTLGVAAGAVATTPGAYVQAAGGTYEVNIANAATYGALQVDGAATLPPSAPIFVRANCGAIAPGATFPGVMTSSNPIAVAGFTVTDNCPNLAFTASLRGDGLAIDLVARADGTAAIPVLSGGGAAALAGLLALSSILVLRRRTRPEVRRGRS